MITVNHTNQVRQICTKSKLPSADYVINPYVGCVHGCIYCYADFMKRFTNHSGEEWGSFLDVKTLPDPIVFPKTQEGTLVIGSVTDPYNRFEEEYESTKKILTALEGTGFNVEIITKSDLVLRDIELLKKIPSCKVSMSLNSLDSSFQSSTEPHAPSAERRIHALRVLRQHGIKTCLFISPIFPFLNDIKPLLLAIEGGVSEIYLENLNIRKNNSSAILDMVREHYPEQLDNFQSFLSVPHKQVDYWESLKEQLTPSLESLGIPYQWYFYHDRIKK